MKKILLSLLTVSAVAAVAFFGTRAFFSDTETSTGNTFTAGAVDLKIDSACSYNGTELTQSGECGVWQEKDLLSEKFFNFSDVKPGDFGKNKISLHVIDNPAYACLYIENMVDAENEINEPESAIDTTANEGELSSELRFFAWGDTDGDGTWNGSETPYFSNVEGPASDVLDGKVYRLPGELPADAVTNLGIYWCYGAMKVNTTEPTFECDGSAVTNKTQTDSLTANLRFYVEQVRHNEGFECPAIVSKTFVYNPNSLGHADNQPGQHTYSTDDPYVTGTPVAGGVELTFHNPTPWLYVFDVRVDGQGGEDRSVYIGTPQTTLIHEGPLVNQPFGPTYQRVVVNGSSESPKTLTFYGTNKIEVGLREGGEQRLYFDWVEYLAQP